MPIHIFATEEI